ncbi:TlpA family protein disulfide reductase [Chloroflexales bacterium ZM16-3]|nr:TlpA family protein disulfide reductase [Chloroflexales bacterium ZM16-3]
MRRSIALIIFALALAACGTSQPAAIPTVEVGNVALATQSAIIDASGGRPTDGEAAPDFSYTMADGSVHTLSELRGKRVLVNFWATWCMPCREEMPELQQTATDNSENLVILGVNRNEAPDAIAKFGNEVGVTFPLIANIAGDIGDRYGATSLPMTYFINSDGTISSRQLGGLSPALLAKHLDALQ